MPDALGAYAQRQVARFHMPGHKGRGMAGFMRPELARWDITELSFSDDLHSPSGIIADAQSAYAKAYGAAHTFFLVNGATAGILAMLLSLPQGSRVLLGRDCHRSAISGVALAGLGCRFVQPAFEAAFGLWGCVTPEALERALREQPADAVLVTSPNYYGLCADIPALSRIAHAHGALFFVDAAHGAHFPFSDALPPTPAGHADAWVNSAHKTMNALGQAAMLHINKGMDASAVQQALSLVQTSSPSYLLLASLDWALYTASRPRCWTQTVNVCHTLEQSIDGLLGLSVLPRSVTGSAGIMHIDPTRVTVDVSRRGITGFAARRALEERDVYVECSDVRRVTCICTPADDPVWYEMLLDGLCTLPYGTDLPPSMPAQYPELKRAMPVRGAVRAQKEAVPLAACAGRIAAGSAGVYPPGIPLWTPGERITEEALAFLKAQRALGAELFGVQENHVIVVRE
ncbi:MAG TPA: aminotransferase class I/II-fold pyridoxal phosphate-dependent enzyme [Feifaniaceae bacterium]|nr:aminotransferase class I/II-fold pyridoxal phosphate-dependent enzyme [Feifaniaceae bacterium]